MEWEVNKGNEDSERRQLNRVLEEIQATIGAIPGGVVETIVPGAGIDVDSTDPANPEVALDASTIATLGLAASAVQPGDNVSVLVNDAGYTTNTGTVTSVDLGASTGLTPSGGPVTGSGVLTYTLSANLQAWHGLATSAKQDSDSDLTAIAALSPSNDDIIQRKAGVWTNRTVAQYKTDQDYQANEIDVDDSGWSVIGGPTVQNALNDTDVAINDFYTLLAGKEPAIAAGTTEQFWRGDKTWTNTLTGDLFLNTTMRIGLGPGGAATNVVFGANALAARTTATGQIAIGGSALAENQSQNNNIAIGNNSMAALTAGTGNTAVGASTLSSSASVGGGNCAFGGSSLAACASSSNVGFGQQTLEVYSAVGTGANCAFGDLAGRLQTSGTRNVYVGRRSGVTATSANANVSGSNNTYVGTDTGPGTTTQLSYATALGSEAISTTSNTVVLGRTTDVTVIGATGNSAGGCKLQVTGHVAVLTAGNGLRVAEGSNAKQGTATLVAGTVTVANTSVTANSRIFLTSQVDGGTPGFLRVSARTAGTSFTITSGSATDTSTVAYEIFEPGT